MNRAEEQKGFLAAGLVLFALFITLAVGKVLLGSDQGADVKTFGRFWVNVIYFIPAGFIVGGLWAGRRSTNWSMGIVVPLTLAFLLFGIKGALVGAHEGWGSAIIFGTLGAAGAVIYLLGLWISQRRPLLGGTFVVGGAVPMGLIMWWLLVPPILVVFLAIFGVRRAQNFTGGIRALP